MSWDTGGKALDSPSVPLRKSSFAVFNVLHAFPVFLAESLKRIPPVFELLFAAGKLCFHVEPLQCGENLQCHYADALIGNTLKGCIISMPTVSTVALPGGRLWLLRMRTGSVVMAC